MSSFSILVLDIWTFSFFHLINVPSIYQFYQCFQGINF